VAIDYNTDLGKVRALIGDTDEAALRISDAEINALLTMNPDVFAAAAMACHNIAAKLGGGRLQLLDIEVDLTNATKHYIALAERMQELSDQEVDFEVVPHLATPSQIRDYLWNRDVRREIEL
jgi:hypothetical protein